jgi:hypothetical protein
VEGVEEVFVLVKLSLFFLSKNEIDIHDQPNTDFTSTASTGYAAVVREAAAKEPVRSISPRQQALLDRLLSDLRKPFPPLPVATDNSSVHLLKTMGRTSSYPSRNVRSGVFGSTRGKHSEWNVGTLLTCQTNPWRAD